MALPYRLLAIDLDGTLLDSSGRVSDANRQALHRAHEAGIAICICTGRNLTESRPVIEALGLELDAGVFVFGAIVADLRNGVPLCRTTMSDELADGLIHHFQSRGHPVLVLYDPGQVGCDYLLIEGQRNREAYDRWLAYAPATTARTSTWKPRACAPLRVGIIEESSFIEQTLRDLKNAFGPQQAKINAIYAPNYGMHVVECFAPMVNKWYGISQLARRRGIAPREIAAVGDDINDLEMITQAGLGVAMGNAIPPIQAAASFHVPTNNDAGVAFLVDKLLSDAPALPKRREAHFAT
jgi:Cof subfamily protein (haloacid dehalogenase superfamily)